jgi:hypothetical protein
METPEHEKKLLLLDNESHPIANGIMRDPTEKSTWDVEVLNGRAEAAAQMRQLQLISLDDDQISVLAQMLGARGDHVQVKPLSQLGEDVRENLRIPVRFQSFIYPLSGDWKGRRNISAVDLSCGGIAFSCQKPLSKGETLEIIVPLHPCPVILTAEILRIRPAPEGNGNIYASKFVGLCDEADKLIREFVFMEQLRQRA